MNKKIIILVTTLLVYINFNLFSQHDTIYYKNYCDSNKYYCVKIFDKEDFIPDTNIYLQFDDTLVRYEENKICFDSLYPNYVIRENGVTYYHQPIVYKKIKLVFFYKNRIITSNIQFTGGFVGIDYFKVDELHRYSRKDFRRFKLPKETMKFAKKFRKHLFYYGDTAPSNGNGIFLPIFTKKDLEKYLYGTIIIEAGGRFVAFDWKEKYKSIAF